MKHNVEDMRKQIGNLRNAVEDFLQAFELIIDNIEDLFIEE